MAPKPTNWAMYSKMVAAGIVCCVGGPALIYYVSPTEEELFLKYNPELQKRSLENRRGKQEDFDHFVNKLKVYSKSDKPIWEAAAADEKTQREGKIAEQVRLTQEIERRKAEIRKSGITPMPGGSL
ncbi:hypothetical protein BJ875DRAFT_477391 [Amylocarpus encephaloides]|uniref:Cytochrome b mRNA-processing protein 4 n=1 Tax=Amylocarpus encephaloides TaxID=45428 RepID=A0A9P7Y7V3_9HELO|nr:hypothetical protein BJ875DRAFT_477391 [Amylocarpus encephaloides]